MSLLNMTILFETPAWLTLIPFALLFTGIMLWRYPDHISQLASLNSKRQSQPYRHPAIDIIASLQQQDEKPERRSSFLIRYAGYAIFISLLLVALAQPYRLGKALPEASHERDIVFMVDSSVSMLLRDYLVNGERVDRMTMMKSILSHFIENMKDNRLALMAFSERPHLVVPLTSDHALLKQQLQRLEPAVLTGRTTDPARALLYARQLFTKDDKQVPVLVMLTGVNRPSRDIDPRTAAEFLAQNGFRLHTIAIGAGSYKADEKSPSALIYQPANFELLEQMAKQGQGQFFPVEDSESLANALLHIQQTEKHKVDTPPRFVKHPLYMWPLLSAITLLSLWQFFTAVRQRA